MGEGVSVSPLGVALVEAVRASMRRTSERKR